MAVVLTKDALHLMVLPPQQPLCLKASNKCLAAFAVHLHAFDTASPDFAALKYAAPGPRTVPTCCSIGSARTAVVKLVCVQTGCMHARGVFHPLLLEPSLPPLKEPPATEAVNYDAAASPGSSAVADSMGKASWEPQQPPRQMYGHRGRPKGKVPCPVDLLVPAGVKVVAVTGPNTGVVPAACYGAPITSCVEAYLRNL